MLLFLFTGLHKCSLHINTHTFKETTTTPATDNIRCKAQQVVSCQVPDLPAIYLPLVSICVTQTALTLSEMLPWEMWQNTIKPSVALCAISPWILMDFLTLWVFLHWPTTLPSHKWIRYYTKEDTFRFPRKFTNLMKNCINVIASATTFVLSTFKQ